MIDSVIACLKYTPGNWQHIYSFVTKLKEKNRNVRLLISQNFSWMNNEFSNITDQTTTSSSLTDVLKDTFLFLLYKSHYYNQYIRKYRPRMILFVMWHPINYFLSRMIRNLSPETKICCWIHEPYKTDKSEYKNRMFQILAIEYLQSMYIPLIDEIILHSERALKAFNTKYHHKGPVRVIPLLFSDACPIMPTAEREYDLTFIGNAVKAKGIESFFNLIKCTLESNPGLKFLLVTSSDVHKYLKELGNGFEKYLNIINKPFITDEEIREACKRSFSVIAPYKETTQSGVVPVSYMCGTPVIGTDIEGLTEWITDKEDGVILPTNFTYKDVHDALFFIKNNFFRLSKNARNKYIVTWDDNNWGRYYNWL